jgi:hypothetical protein
MVLQVGKIFWLFFFSFAEIGCEGVLDWLEEISREKKGDVAGRYNIKHRILEKRLVRRRLKRKSQQDTIGWSRLIHGIGDVMTATLPAPAFPDCDLAPSGSSTLQGRTQVEGQC